jgi:hypothetical protein
MWDLASSSSCRIGLHRERSRHLRLTVTGVLRAIGEFWWHSVRSGRGGCELPAGQLGDNLEPVREFHTKDQFWQLVAIVEWWSFCSTSTSFKTMVAARFHRQPLDRIVRAAHHCSGNRPPVLHLIALDESIERSLASAFVSAIQISCRPLPNRGSAATSGSISSTRM